MSSINGISVPVPIVPPSTSDTNPTHYAQYGVGGLRSVVTASDLQTIPNPRLEAGMVTVTQDELIAYTLASDLRTHIPGLIVNLPATTQYFIDPVSSSPLTGNGSYDAPFLTIAAAINRASANGVSVSAPIYLSLMGPSEEVVTLTQGGAYIGGFNKSGITSAIPLTGAITINGSNSSQASNVFAIDGLAVQSTAEIPLSFSGLNPQILNLKDVWLTTSSIGSACLLVNNSAAGNIINVDKLKLSQLAPSGTNYALDISNATVYIKDLISTDQPQYVGIVRSGKLYISYSRDVRANGSYILHVQSGAELHISDSYLTNVRVNGSGIQLESGATAYINNVEFNISSGTGYAIDGPTGSTVYYNNLSFLPGSNTAINPAITMVPLANLGGTGGGGNGSGGISDVSIGGATGLLADVSSSGALTLRGTLNPTAGGSGVSTAPTSGQILIGNSSGGYSLTTLTQGSNILISNAAGVLTISSPPPAVVTELTQISGLVKMVNGTPGAATHGNTTQDYTSPADVSAMILAALNALPTSLITSVSSAFSIVNGQLQLVGSGGGSLAAHTIFYGVVSAAAYGTQAAALAYLTASVVAAATSAVATLSTSTGNSATTFTYTISNTGSWIWVAVPTADLGGNSLQSYTSIAPVTITQLATITISGVGYTVGLMYTPQVSPPGTMSVEWLHS